MSQPTIAVAVVIDQGRVLIGRRSPTAASAAGLHEFPGGKVEAGEDPATAAQRECQEETGLPVAIGRLLTKSTVADTGATIFFFEGSVTDDKLLRPCRPFTWLTADDLRACQFPPANNAVLDWLRTRLRSA